MKKSTIELSLVAYTDAAGKSVAGAPREGNEDNFYVNYSIGDSSNSNPSSDVFSLGKCGILMAVADGMGGMNAGEIASQIAIDTVKEAFEKAQLPPAQLSDVNFRRKYLEKVIKNADSNIKNSAKANHAQENMGSTIVLAWLYGNELTLSWCGDSRLYVFNPQTGIRLISRDHSYVQELVSKGVLTYDQTFDHPQNNIITRSLGDTTKDIKPESKTIVVGKGDIILLCSDGLSGVLRDRKTYDAQGALYPGQNIEDIMRDSDNLKDCRENLWHAAEAQGWYDNVTVILCEIVDGPESPLLKVSPKPDKNRGYSKWKYLSIILGIIIIILLICLFITNGKKGDASATGQDSIGAMPPDTIKVQEVKEPAKAIIQAEDKKDAILSHFEEKEAPEDTASILPEMEENGPEAPIVDELTKIQPKVDNLTPIKKNEISPTMPTPTPTPDNQNDVPENPSIN